MVINFTLNTYSFLRVIIASTMIFLSMIHWVSATENRVQKNHGQWLDSEELQPGMKILTSDNRLFIVTDSWQQRQLNETTYNFEVANHHTYFVSEQQLWVHNTCIDDFTSDYVIAEMVNGSPSLRIAESIPDKEIVKLLENISQYARETGKTVNVSASIKTADRMSDIGAATRGLADLVTTTESGSMATATSELAEVFDSLKGLKQTLSDSPQSKGSLAILEEMLFGKKGKN